MRIVSRSSLGNVEAYTIQHRSVIVHAGVGGGGTGKQCVVLVQAGGEAAQLGYNKEGLEPAWVCAPACVPCAGYSPAAGYKVGHCRCHSRRRSRIQHCCHLYWYSSGLTCRAQHGSRVVVNSCSVSSGNIYAVVELSIWQHEAMWWQCPCNVGRRNGPGPVPVCWSDDSRNAKVKVIRAWCRHGPAYLLPCSDWFVLLLQARMRTLKPFLDIYSIIIKQAGISRQGMQM